MPDRDLPEELKARLAAELSSGAPLRAPSASQARYATAAPAAVPLRRLGGRVTMLAAAALVVLAAVTFAGPPQPRAWLVRTVGNIAGDLGAHVGTSSPSPGNPASSQSSPRGGTDDASSSPRALESPDTDETPGAQQSPEPRESPEPTDSPEPTQSPDGGETPGGDGDHSSPNPSPSSGEDGSDGGH